MSKRDNAFIRFMDWTMDQSLWISMPVLFGTAALLVLILVIPLSIIDNMKWEKYKDENHCVDTGIERRHWHWRGKTGSHVREVEYLCDGGERIWRNE